eukprot:g3038.t1
MLLPTLTITVSILCTAQALMPTKVEVSNCFLAKNQNWLVNAPTTTDPLTPHFNLTATNRDLSFNPKGLTYRVQGSLGLAHLGPLGIFKFNQQGTLCDTKDVAYVNDGTLGKIQLHAPCSGLREGEEFEFSGEVSVYTSLPVIPKLKLATSFDAEVSFRDSSNKRVFCVHLRMEGDPSQGPDPAQDKCNMDTAPKIPDSPPPDKVIPEYTIDLDTDPRDRWAEIVKPRVAGMKNLVHTFIHGSKLINNTLTDIVVNNLAKREMKRMPQEYAEEMKGIASATGLQLGWVWIINMMYELTGFCTSAVVQDSSGIPWHARNLDFGEFFGNDKARHTWSLTGALRDLLVTVKFTRSGNEVYKSTTYAGFVGVLSASKAGAFSISVDTRYDTNLDKGIIGWLFGKYNDHQFLTFETRNMMEQAPDYDSALNGLLTYKSLGPAYIIIAGTKSGEGAIIAKQFAKKGTNSSNADVWYLSDAVNNGSFFIIETNYDRTGPPPPFDDRRYPATNCIKSLGPDNINRHSLMQVLSSNPTMNAATTFSSVMVPASGHYEARKQECLPGLNCAPF